MGDQNSGRDLSIMLIGFEGIPSRYSRDEGGGTAMRERLTWAELPQEVQDWVQDTLGSPVEEAVSQASGFSLGTADRLSCSNGRRAFLKAVNEADQPQTAALHRAEIKASCMIPEGAPTPTLLAAYDREGWVAILLEDIAGRHPHTPWEEEDLKLSLIALSRLAALSPAGLEDLDDLTESIGDEIFVPWEKIRAQPLHRGLYSHLEGDTHLDELELLFPQLNQKAASYLETILTTVNLSGNSLSHTDVRADNILIGDQGRSYLIDWPWACRGAAYFDSALLLGDVVAQGGDFSWDRVCSYSELLAATPPSAIDACLIAFAGYYVWSAQLPSRGDTHSSLPNFRLARALRLCRWILEHKL